MKALKKLFCIFFAFIAVSSLFGNEGEDLKLVLNAPKGDSQLFSINVFPNDKNLQTMRLNLDAMETRFALEMSCKIKSSQKTETAALDYNDTRFLKINYKAFKIDRKNGAYVEMRTLSRKVSKVIRMYEKKFPNDMLELEISFSFRNLTPQTQDGKTKYTTSKATLNREQILAFLKAHGM